MQAIAAAARAALLDRGYTVRSASATADSARVEGDAPEFGPLDLVVVTAEARAGSGMRVTVRVEPLGDETRSRDILDALLARLAL